MPKFLNAEQLPVWFPYTQMSGANVMHVAHGQGCWLFDSDGHKYLDAISSWWTNLHGHAHPHIASAIATQARELEHVIFAGIVHTPALRLAERLLKHLPGSHEKIFYSDNGSTAVEVALKMAVQYWKNKGEERRKFLVFHQGYHGDTFGSMSASERGLFTAPYRELLFPVEFLPAPEAGSEETSIQRMKLLLQDHSKELAGFIFEPLVQGAAGMLVHDAAALSELMRLCRKYGVLTIADEVMTGFGRTGRFFASDYLDGEPDLICLSKGLTGGFLPMGITSCTQEIFETFLNRDQDPANRTFYHGHSYTANPLGCAAALASLDLMERDALWRQIEMIQNTFQTWLPEIRPHHKISKARAFGTIIAFDLNTGNTGYSNPVRDKVTGWFLERGILLRPLGSSVYLMPPYCITAEELKMIYENIQQFLEEF